MSEKVSRGRPRDGGTKKRRALNMKTTDELREKIEEAADANGLSLTQEIERRLLTSFTLDSWVGGAHIRSLVQMMGTVIAQIEKTTGKKWTQDVKTWEAVSAATTRLLRWDRPPNKDQKQADLNERARQASEDYNEAREALESFRTERGVLPYYIPSGPRRGLFGRGQPTAADFGANAAGARTSYDVRAGWSDEEIETEQRLEAEMMDASSKLAAAVQASQEHRAPHVEKMKQGQEIGNREAEEWITLLGPKRLR